MCRKDLLLRVLRKMKAVHGAVYAFHPDSYMLPTEYTKFIGEFTRLQNVRKRGFFFFDNCLIWNRIVGTQIQIRRTNQKSLS